MREIHGPRRTISGDGKIKAGRILRSVVKSKDVGGGSGEHWNLHEERVLSVEGVHAVDRVVFVPSKGRMNRCILGQ